MEALFIILLLFVIGLVVDGEIFSIILGRIFHKRYWVVYWLPEDKDREEAERSTVVTGRNKQEAFCNFMEDKVGWSKPIIKSMHEIKGGDIL